jgi:hypothetical protein
MQNISVRQGLQKIEHRNLIDRCKDKEKHALLPGHPTFVSMAMRSGVLYVPQHLGYLSTALNHVGEFVPR